jgi:uncharacterized OsmC-like protein
MSNHVGHFVIAVERVDGYEFRVRFDKEHYAELHTDEPAPLGKDRAPNAARFLAAAVGNCLAASLVFCASKSKTELVDLKSEVRVDLVRNEHKRLRVGQINVKLSPKLAAGASIDSCLEVFQDFCVVTESVREGIDVQVSVDVTRAEG